MALLYRRTGRLTPKTGGFRPGQLIEFESIRGEHMHAFPDLADVCFTKLKKHASDTLKQLRHAFGCVAGRGLVSLLTILDTWHSELWTYSCRRSMDILANQMFKYVQRCSPQFILSTGTCMSTSTARGRGIFSSRTRR
jgi:hypothetical protein